MARPVYVPAQRSAQEPPGRASAPPWLRRLTEIARKDPIKTAALLVGVLPYLWHVWATLESYFVQDDFIYIYRAAHEPLSLHYLLPSGYNVHLFPGQFLVVWLVTRLAPMNHTIAVLPLLVLHGVATMLLWRLLVKVFGRRWAILVPFAVFTFSPLVLVTTLWWAFALEIVPFFAALFGAASALVNYLHSGRRRDAVISVVYVGGGLVFWEKAALIPFLLFGLAVALTPDDDLGTVTSSTLRRYGWLWTSFAGVLLTYAGLYFLFTSTAGGGNSHQPGGVIDLGQRMIVEQFVPRIVGGPWNANFGGVNPPSALSVLLAFVIAIVVVRRSLLTRRRQAARAWVVVAAYLLADVVLLAVARLGAIGALIGNDPRYVTDAVPVVVIFGALALMQPITVSTDRDAIARSDDQTLEHGRAALVLVAVFALGAVVTVAATQSQQMAGPAKRFTVAAVAATHKSSLVLFDGGPPGNVILPSTRSDWRVSRVIGLFPSGPKFDVPTDRLFILNTHGEPEPFTFFYPVFASPGPVPQCGYLTTDTGTTIPLRMTTPHVVVKLAYYTGQASSGFVRVGGQTFNVKFEPNGVRALYVVVERPFTSIEVGSGFPTCIVETMAGGPTRPPKS